MGEEVEEKRDLIVRLNESAYAWDGIDPTIPGELREAADTTESLRASLTRVEEERDEAERVLERISGGTELDEEWFAESPPIWAQDDFNGNSAASCGYCGSWHEVVRPGKTQCPCCGDGQDKAAIAAARLRETRLSRANAAQE